jgi:Domain of unknown function (DUF4209)
MIGKLYEDVAKFKINNKEHLLVASFFYQKAYNEYERAGNKEKYEKCLRLCSENTIFDKPTIVEFEIPAINVSGHTENEIINNLIKLFFENQNTVLDEETNRRMIFHEINKHPLSSALFSQNYTKMGPSSPVSVTNEEKLSSEIKLAIKNNINLFDATICRTFAILESENKITAFGIQHFLNTYRILDANCIFLLNQGFKHHFENDFVASIHVLTPQIESVLRKLLELKKVNFFKLKKDAIMSKELGGLLELDELLDVLSPNLIKYLKLKYTDINGLNFRNNLSHGLLQQEDFNHINSCSIIYSIMLILKTSDKI